MLTAGTVLQKRYRVVRHLAKGGMGAVYEAIDMRLGAAVALKETLFTDEILRKQFEREARLLARLHHPALPLVSDHFVEGDGQFLVMQLIRGDDLEELRRKNGGSFAPKVVLGWADQLLDALDYLHTQDRPIIHRDIKPQNIKLTGRGQVILLDFGLAKGSAPSTTPATAPDSFPGFTLSYAPPEQIRGVGTEPRSDLYSLAATLHHLISGERPPDAYSRGSATYSGQPDPLLPLHALNQSVTPAVSAVLQQAMALAPERRPATAAQMRAALAAAQRGAFADPSADEPTVLDSLTPVKGQVAPSPALTPPAPNRGGHRAESTHRKSKVTPRILDSFQKLY